MKTILRVFLLLFLVTTPHNFAHASITPDSPFQVFWNEESLKLAPGNSFELKLTIRVPEGYYLYAEETDVEFLSLEGILIKDVKRPKPTKHFDTYLNKNVDIYLRDTTISIEGRVPQDLSPGEHDLVAKVSFRGCSQAVCYRPQETEVSFKIDVTTASSKPEVLPKQIDSPENDKVKDEGLRWQDFKNLTKISDFSRLTEKGIALTIIIVFIAGLLTSLTPCVWPVIPIVLLFIGVHPRRHFFKNLSLSASLASGLILVYAVLGIIAVALGKNLGFLFQQRIFLVLVVLFFLAMSLSMFGAFDLRLPKTLSHRLHKLGGKGYRGAFLAGMGTGLVASPCAGPVLAALLGHVALQRNYLTGFLLLVVYGLGLSILIIIISASYGELAGRLKSGPWMVWIRRVLGLILLFPAAFYMGSLFHWDESIFQWDKNKPHVEWILSEENALKFALETHRPIMIEFGAAWCPPCRELENNFFTREEIARLSYQLVPFKVDATIETKEVRRLVEKYHVSGWPTVLFLAPDGDPYSDLKINNYDPNLTERYMKEALKRAKR